VAWIVGVGASAGLGAALGRRFSKSGLIAVLTGRNAQRIETIAREIEAAGSRAVALPGDVSSAAELERLAGAVAGLSFARGDLQCWQCRARHATGT